MKSLSPSSSHKMIQDNLSNEKIKKKIQLRGTTTTKAEEKAIMNSTKYQSIEPSLYKSSDEFKQLWHLYHTTGHTFDPVNFQQQVAVHETFSMKDDDAKRDTICKLDRLGSQIISQLKLPKELQEDQVSRYAHSTAAVISPTILQKDCDIMETDTKL